jgi:deoxyribodipyrimidine photolyase
MTVLLLWLRRDLRVHDHPELFAAALRPDDAREVQDQAACRRVREMTR